MQFKVAFLGFSEFERNTLASYFRLAAQRTPSFRQVVVLTEADFMVADADHEPSVQLVQATDRHAETVFIGSRAPPGSRVWMPRPIDGLHVMRALDAMVAQAPDDGWPALQGEPRAQAAPCDIPVPVHGHHPAPSPLKPPPADVPVLMSAIEVPGLQAPAVPAIEPWALLVDDSEIALRFLESRLQRWPFKIDRAAGSAQALQRLAGRSYDLVFLDVELGENSELDGLALCQRIKQSAAAVNTSVVLVSAHHTELDRVRGALAGCDAYLGKPLNEIELQRLLLRHGLKLPKEPSAAA